MPVTDQGLIRSTISATSLGHAQRIVGNIRSDYQTCQAAYQSLQAFQQKQSAYTKALDAYKKKYHQTTAAPVKEQGGKVIATPPPKPAGTQPTIPARLPRAQRGSGDRDSAVSVVATPGQPGDPAGTGPVRAPL